MSNTVFLVCSGDCESHEVIYASLSEEVALNVFSACKDNARNNFVNSDDELEECEIALCVLDKPRHKGRMFGYYCVEQHELV